jgi:ATP-dependent helicase Lhr and Lhr-like helicase
VRRTGLLPSRIENALAELVANGWVTSDSFEGLRALLVPDEKREPFGPARQRRHRRAVTSIEYAGRWSVVRSLQQNFQGDRDASLEIYARTLLRRYGVVFRRMLERESLGIRWFELLRVYRRLEARGEIRGGYFVSGVNGEQFALPEAVGLLRSTRRNRARSGQEGREELVTISGADPLNLVGILAPGQRIAAITAHRILLRDGVAIAFLKAGQLISLEPETIAPSHQLERALRVGTLSPALRPYYA